MRNKLRKGEGLSRHHRKEYYRQRAAASQKPKLRTSRRQQRLEAADPLYFEMKRKEAFFKFFPHKKPPKCRTNKVTN